jgi:ferrous iron transport protein A
MSGVTKPGLASRTAAVRPQEVVALSELAEGCVARLERVEGGAVLRSRLMAMGIRRNVRVRVVQNRGRGAVVLAVGEMRVVLGRGMAHKVAARVTASAEEAERDPDA